MADRRYRPVNFGFLNTAQDPTDIGEFESPYAVNLDPDELALGSLKHKQYSSEGALKDQTTCTLGGRVLKLGDNDTYYTTYSGTGFSSSEPVLLSDTGDFLYMFDVYLTSLDDGFIIGNKQLVGDTDRGVSFFEISSGDLDYVRYTAAATPTTIQLIPTGTLATGTWYRIAVRSRADSGYVEAYVDGVYVGRSALVARSSEDSRVFCMGDDGYAGGADFRLRNILFISGLANSPDKWDGRRLSTVGLEGDYTTIVASRFGSGLDSAQGLGFSGDAVTTDTFNDTTGRIYAEARGAESAELAPAYTQYYSKSPVALFAQTDQDVQFGDVVYVRFRMDYNYFTTGTWTSQTFFHFGPEGTAEAMEFDMNEAAGWARVRFETTTTGWSSYYNVIETSKLSVNREYVFIMYSKTIDSGTEYAAKVSVDGEVVVDEVIDSNDFVISNTGRQICVPNTLAYSGTGNSRLNLRELSVGVLRVTDEIEVFDGSYSMLQNRYNPAILISSEAGSIIANDQGIPASNTATSSADPSDIAAVTGTVPAELTEINNEYGPATPIAPKVDVVEKVDIDDSALPTAAATLATIGVQPGKAYNGPPQLTFTVKYDYDSTRSWRDTLVQFKPSNAKSSTNYYSLNNEPRVVRLPHNLMFTYDGSTNPLSLTSEYTIQVEATDLLDGKYVYKLVNVRYSDMSPKNEVNSIPSRDTDIDIRNLDASGQKTGNLAPVITLPGVSPGYPNYVDRVDLYRSDPDTEDFVKITESTSASPVSYTDLSLITDLPRIIFLSADRDESFDTINAAISNPSGTFDMLMEKDNRLWAVPSDRKDLLLYSRENDWWGWRRENSFSFNGDIVDVVAIRDINVVNGESTLVVFTTKGIYHVLGSGVESSPYVRVPMFGGDGNSEINMYAGSALPFNGSIFFLSKSTDGGYETGAYGQKVYEYNLQQLTELSGRIKKDATDPYDLSPPTLTLIDGDTNELEYASLVGGDKYIIKKLTNGDPIVYHKDARGWLSYSSTASQDWVWLSKKFDRQSKERGTIANASRVKIDYIGDVTLEFIVHAPDGSFQSKSKSLSSVTRATWENMLPANMGSAWQFKLTGDQASSAQVFNMWFS